MEEAINIMRIQKFNWRGGQRYFVRVRVRRTVERSRMPPEEEESVETIFAACLCGSISYVEGNYAKPSSAIS